MCSGREEQMTGAENLKSAFTDFKQTSYVLWFSMLVILF